MNILYFLLRYCKYSQHTIFHVFNFAFWYQSMIGLLEKSYEYVAFMSYLFLSCRITLNNVLLGLQKQKNRLHKKYCMQRHTISGAVFIQFGFVGKILYMLSRLRTIYIQPIYYLKAESLYNVANLFFMCDCTTTRGLISESYIICNFSTVNAVD